MLNNFKKVFASILVVLLAFTNFSCIKNYKSIPLPSSSNDDVFSVDKNINMSTIDDYLFREDIVYRDVRMLFDTAKFEDIGGEADLTSTIEGFKIVPYPYIASLQVLPVANPYNGSCLYDVIWSNEGKIVAVKQNFIESEIILNELFPKNKKIFLMCGGGGYANMMRLLLIYLGWNENDLYNVGANWEYKGKYRKELVIYPEDVNGKKIYATWRADYAYIPFEKLHKK